MSGILEEEVAGKVIVLGVCGMEKKVSTTDFAYIFIVTVAMLVKLALAIAQYYMVVAIALSMHAIGIDLIRTS